MLLFNFEKSTELANWQVVNDGVMGGLSSATLQFDSAGHAIYQGRVSLENNGGFSSIRTNFNTQDVSSFSEVCLRIKGDGKRYQFRMKSTANQRYSYIHHFETSGEWEEITLPFAQFYPAFRGRKLDQPNFNGKTLGSVSFLIGNKKAESFELMIERIELR
ncbi:MAG: CIA30 family protein [Saprospiraceae bacterium]